MEPRAALLVLDMLNPYEHDDADALAASVERVVEPLRGLVARAAADAGVELVYVNDNHGDFAATREDLVERALAGRHPRLVEPLLRRPAAPSCRRCATAPSTAPRSTTCCASAGSGP